MVLGIALFKKSHTYIVWMLFCLGLSGASFGQYYDSGQDPFRLKWRQMNTNRFQLIYPEGIDSLAAQYLWNLESVAQQEKRTVTYFPKHIPVVLHPNTIISNGEVGWAPKRMNLYLVAPQDNYFQPWNEQLSIHEFRHTVQLSKLNQGATRFLNLLMGEQATGFILGWHIPLWFVEGDAVCFETGSSQAGRGRVPDFNMRLKAQVLEKGIYSYPKAIFGSYKDFVPNRYELGYYLVANGRNQFSNSLWDQVLDKVARSPIHPNPFSASIKKQTGFSERNFYMQSMLGLHDSPIDRVKNEKAVKQVVNSNSNDYVNYYNPTKTDDGMVAFKTSYSSIPAFVSIDANGNEKLLHQPGYVFDNTFSANDSLLIWNEFKNTRWENENFSRIVVYNLRTDKLDYLTSSGRIFYSRLSPGADALLSVEVDEKINWTLTLRDFKTGEVFKQFAFDTIQPVQPDWAPDGKSAVFVGISFKGKSLGLVDLVSENIRWILKDESMEFSQPKWTGKGIVLKGAYKNTSNFFLYDLTQNTWSLLTDEPYGVNEGNITENSFLYSTYTSDGFKIECTDSAFTKDLRGIKPSAFQLKLADNLQQEETQVVFSLPHQSYPSKEYHRFSHLVNIHSWAPLAIRVDNQEVGLGLTLLSQDVLSTSFLSLGYQRHEAEAYDEYFIDYQYKGFYPLLDTKYSLIPFSSYQPRDSIPRLVEGVQHIITQTWQVPFYFNRGKWYRLVQPELGYNLVLVDYKPNLYFEDQNKYIHQINAGLYAYNLMKQSYRDLYPKWGQSVYVTVRNVPMGSYAGSQFVAYTRLYFPGLAANHSFRVYAGFQKQDQTGWPFYNKLATPRGYYTLSSAQMLSTRAEYAFPLVYPDVNYCELLYIKRIRTNLFYDVASYDNRYWQQSVGIELGYDFHALRLITPFELSFRYAYQLSEQSHFFEVNYAVNFNALYGNSEKNSIPDK